MRKVFAWASILALGGCVVAPPAPYGQAAIPYGCMESGSTISCQRPDGSVSTTTAPDVMPTAPAPVASAPLQEPPPPPGDDAGPGYPPPPGYDGGGPDYPPPPPPGYYGNGY